MIGEMMNTFQYPSLNTKSDKSQSTSVSTKVPIALVLINFRYLLRSLSISYFLLGMGSISA